MKVSFHSNTRPLKVAIAASNPKGKISGGRYHSSMMAYGLASLGCEVAYITNTRPYLDEEIGSSGLSSIRIIIEADFKNNIPQIKESFDYLIVIPTGIIEPDYYFYCRMAAYQCQARLVLVNFESPNWFNAISPQKKSTESWEDWQRTIFKSGMILSSTQESTRWAKDYYPQLFNNNHAFKTWSPPINTHIADETSIENSRHGVTVFIRTSDPHKGAHDLLELEPEVFESTTLTLVFPDTPDTHFAHRLQTHLNSVSGAKLQLLARLSEKEKFDLLARSKVLLTPTRFEGYGYPVLEGAYMGAEVVCYELAVFKETVGEIAFFAQIGDTQDLGLCIKKAITNQRSPSSIRAAVNDLVSFESSSKRLLETLLKAYDTIEIAGEPYAAALPTRGSSDATTNSIFSSLISAYKDKNGNSVSFTIAVQKSKSRVVELRHNGKTIPFHFIEHAHSIFTNDIIYFKLDATYEPHIELKALLEDDEEILIEFFMRKPPHVKALTQDLRFGYSNGEIQASFQKSDTIKFCYLATPTGNIQVDFSDKSSEETLSISLNKNSNWLIINYTYEGYLYVTPLVQNSLESFYSPKYRDITWHNPFEVSINLGKPETENPTQNCGCTVAELSTFESIKFSNEILTPVKEWTLDGEVATAHLSFPISKPIHDNIKGELVKSTYKIYPEEINSEQFSNGQYIVPGPLFLKLFIFKASNFLIPEEATIRCPKGRTIEIERTITYENYCLILFKEPLIDHAGSELYFEVSSHKTTSPFTTISDSCLKYLEQGSTPRRPLVNSTEKRILFLTLTPPTPSNQGNRVVTKSWISFFISQGYFVDIVCLGHPDTIEFIDSFGPAARCFPMDFFDWEKSPGARLRQLASESSFDRKYSPSNAWSTILNNTGNHEFHPFYIIPDSFVKVARSLLKSFEYEHIICNYTSTLRVPFELQNEVDLPKCTVVTHDALSNLKDTSNGITIDLLYRKCSAEVERATLDSVPNTTVVAITKEEKKYFQKIGVNNQIIVSGVDSFSPLSHQFTDPNTFHSKTLVFHGSSNPMNLIGINWFLTNCWQEILDKEPNVQLKIIGRICEKLPEKLPGVQILGLVSSERLAYELKNSTLAINPTIVGTGLKIKSMEAASIGLPSVFTSLAIEGYQKYADQLGIKADTPTQFSNAIIEIIGNPQKHNDFRKTCRQFAAKHLSTDATFKEVSKALKMPAASKIQRTLHSEGRLSFTDIPLTYQIQELADLDLATQSASEIRDLLLRAFSKLEAGAIVEASYLNEELQQIYGLSDNSDDAISLCYFASVALYHTRTYDLIYDFIARAMQSPIYFPRAYTLLQKALEGSDFREAEQNKMFRSSRILNPVYTLDKLEHSGIQLDASNTFRPRLDCHSVSLLYSMGWSLEAGHIWSERPSAYLTLKPSGFQRFKHIRISFSVPQGRSYNRMSLTIQNAEHIHVDLNLIESGRVEIETPPLLPSNKGCYILNFLFHDAGPILDENFEILDQRKLGISISSIELVA